MLRDFNEQDVLWIKIPIIWVDDLAKLMVDSIKK